MPDIRCTRLRATRSARSTDRAEPSTRASTAPAGKRLAILEPELDDDV